MIVLVFVCTMYCKFTKAMHPFVNEYCILKCITSTPTKKKTSAKSKTFCNLSIPLRTPGLGQTGQELWHSALLILIAVFPPPECRCMVTSDTEFVLNSENGRMERWEEKPTMANPVYQSEWRRTLARVIEKDY